VALPSTIRLACRNYDGTNAILRGIVRTPELNLEVIERDDVPGMFAGMFKGAYDVSEMSLGELIYYTSRGKAEFVGIPIFPSRMFRHGFLFCRRAAGIKEPRDLSGKNIGFLRWVQTAAIWMRGLLVEEYGVSAKDSRWHVGSIHHWDDADPNAEIAPRDGSVVRWIQGAGRNAAERACRALLDGELDLLGITESQLPMLLGRSDVRRLFENPREVEADYFRKTRILPIMHVLTIRREVIDQRPQLPLQMFHLFSEAKHWARKWRREMPSLVEAWPQHHLDEERKIFGTDPWAYGLEANRHVITKFLSYCYAQGVSAREITPEELFHPSTLQLAE
jgi:4,5-dihydroxyphthalate decarboxylase